MVQQKLDISTMTTKQTYGEQQINSTPYTKPKVSALCSIQTS